MNRLRLLLFAFGDFAFNLYWQSIMLYLLFYYTDAIGLPIGVAAAIFLVASVWDGIANFAAGVLADQGRFARNYGAVLAVGAIPLGLSFVLTYLPPIRGFAWPMGLVLAGHLLFRTAYAAVNVPYLAMTARISTDTGDRSFVAGMRMLFGTLAAVLVARGTLPVGQWLLGDGPPATAYFGTAMLSGGVGAAILLVVGLTYRDAPLPEPQAMRPRIRDALTSLARNRAFVTLNLAMMAMIVAITVLNKSILYYFKYFLHDPEGGQLALASMGLVSALAVPAWMLASRMLGLRGVWFAAAGLAMSGLGLFAAEEFGRTTPMQIFLVFMQVATVGLNFVFWAMLPNTVEYGEKETGLRVEGTIFGFAALLQRIAIAAATGILGWSFGTAGYVANVDQSPATLEAMRATIAFVPLGFLALSCGLMLLNPLRKGAHARIVRALEQSEEAVA